MNPDDFDFPCSQLWREYYSGLDSGPLHRYTEEEERPKRHSDDYYLKLGMSLVDDRLGPSLAGVLNDL